MSYVDEIYERVVAQNPGEPEFHQAVKEVLDSLKLVIDANEEKYRREGVLERFTEPERVFRSTIYSYLLVMYVCSSPKNYCLYMPLPLTA